MQSKAIWIGGLVVGLGLVACGGSVETSNTGGSTSTGTGGNGGSGGNTGGTGGGSGGIGGSGGAGGACAAYADQPGQGSVKVVFRNNSGQTIYLPGMCAGVDYLIVGAVDGTSGYVYDKSCLQTCEDLQSSYPFVCGACQPTTYRIEHGGTYETTWDGTRLLNNVAMPEACWFDGGNQSACSQIFAATAGKYHLEAYGYSGCEGGCTCDPSGICFGSAAGSPAYHNPVQFNFPADKTVEVLFDTCAFGCPE